MFGQDVMNMYRTTSLWVLTIAAGLAAILWTGLARAESASFKIPLSGAECKPAVETAATGTAALTYDPSTRVLNWDISYGGLSSPATQAHVHGPGAEPGKNVVIAWLSPAGSPPQNPITGQATLTPEQVSPFDAGQWYVNLHTQSHPACELRGQVVPPKG
jgi:hypothetical protein